MDIVDAYRSQMKKMIVLGAPLAAGYIVHVSIGVTDTIMLGRYSVDALAAVVLGHTYFFVFFIVGGGFGHAVMPLVASAVSSGDDLQVRRFTRMGLWLSAAFSIIFLGSFWFSSAVLQLLGQDPSLSLVAQGYLRVVGFALFPALMVIVIKSYLSALELMRAVLLITLGGFIINIPLNYCLIFGNWGAPELGVQGAAIASLVVNIFMALGVALYAQWVLPAQQIFARLWRPDWSAMVKVAKLGAPIGATSFAEVGLFSGASFMMGWLGTVPLAAHGVALQLTSLAFVVHVGLSGAATILVGKAYGRQDKTTLRQVSIAAFALSMVFATLTAIAYVTIPAPLLAAFIDAADPAFDQIIFYGSALLLMSALFQVVDAAQVMGLGFLRGIQDTAVPMAMAVVSYWIIGLPIAYIFCFIFDWGGPGLWAGLAVGLAAAAVMMLARFLLLLKRL